MDDAERAEAGARLLAAVREIDDLSARIHALAEAYAVGPIDPVAFKESVFLPILGTESATDDEIRDTARDFLSHALLAIGAARVEIDQDSDAAGAVPHLIKAARIYGLTTQTLMSWRHGVRPLRKTLEAARMEDERKKRVLAAGRVKGAEANRQRSREAKEKARHWALEALNAAKDQRPDGVPIGDNLEARAKWVAERLRVDGIVQANGKHYALTTIRRWIAGL